MIDRNILVRIVGIAQLNKDDVVLEIGGGKGALTEYLGKIAKHVFVIEKDEGLFDFLEGRFANFNHISFCLGNALDVDFPKYNKCISNLPYTLCEALLWKFVREDFDCLVFVVPKKFTGLLTGVVESRLKLLVDAFYELEVLDDVPPEAFDPEPKIMSSIIRLKPKEGNLFLREFFSQYDKKTKNALREILMKSGMTKKEAIKQVSLSIPLVIQEKNIVNLSLEEIKEVIRGFIGE